ncbi:MAG TPA: 1-deoxy-D-xylulose-5-phosphate synthase N-terminal domain-containing protein [Candidatus Kapabacteria bacterium]|jgi:transketolase|nr:1-deoxy-D-xylulose-5-phosphate synthase N-terminal domain-containing protein [Candidatus Kapabacteria bacterium]
MNNPLSPARLDELNALALRVREHIIRMSTDGGCFIGASLSCADLLVYLYSQVLDITPDRTRDPNRDYLLLSKGHDVPALYGTLAELGYFPKERLQNHLKTNDHIYWHPNRNIPGVEFHSGSLGHLLSVAIGIAMDIKLRKTNNRVFVILGDGELNEGTIWEGMLTAAAHKLDNLIAVVDRNEFQANIRTEDLIPLEPLVPKFEAMGWNASRTNGHDFMALGEIFSTVQRGTGKPTVIVADTVRGKGLPSIERRADRWFVNFSHDEVRMLLDELHGEHSAELTSETLMVR